MPDQATFKSGWCKHHFDEMAVMINDRIDDPREADVEFYVGLEHLDSDSLTIRRWGSPSDVEATKLRFRAGDVIFGRRRVYQRKMAVADFDGICSAHAMVLRARPEVCLPEFLPFFMQSDLFMGRAKEISVGSLSPTINWKTLAKERFTLPPLEEQRRMVQALSAAEGFLEAMRAMHASNRLLARAVINRLILGDLAQLPTELTEGLNVDEWQESTLGELCILSGGHGFRPEDWSDPIPRIVQ
jgi:type I restriction enzyme S subunit